MGQIVGGAAKPKRCNLNKLSQLGTPAAGEHILVSSDNSMNAAGQGNFDCYIVGDGTKAATELELKSLADSVLLKSKNSVQNAAVKEVFDNVAVELGGSNMTIIPIMWESGTYYDSSCTKRSNASYSSSVLSASQYKGKNIYISFLSTGANIYIHQKDINGTLIYSQNLDSNTVYPLVMAVKENAETIYLSNRSSLGVGDAWYNEISYNNFNIADDVNVIKMEEEIPVSWVDNKYYSADGTLQYTPSNYAAAEIDISAYSGKIIRLSLFGYYNSFAFSLLKTTNGNIYWSHSMVDDTYETDLLIPNFVNKLLLTNRTASGFPRVSLASIEITKKTIANAAEESKKAKLSASMLGIFADWEKGVYYTSTGGDGTNASYERAKIDVSSFVGLSYLIHTYLPTGAIAYTLFVDGEGSILESYRNVADLTGVIPSTAKYLYISNRYAGTSPFVRYPYIFIEHAYGLPLLSEIVHTGEYTILKDKRVSIIGDSITEGTGAGTGTKYTDVFGSLAGCTINNLGLAGTTIADGGSGYTTNRFVTRATAENLSGSDLVIVFGGTNDFTKDVKTIGELFAEEDITATTYRGVKRKIAPSDVDAFGGALHNLINTIRTNCPNKPIIFITPLNRGVFTYKTDMPSSHESNQHGLYMKDYSDAIKEVCAFYSIPVLDLGSVSQLDFANASIASAYSSDNLHPNVAGHRVIANLLFEFVKEKLPVLP